MPKTPPKAANRPTWRITDHSDRELLAVIAGISNGDTGATALEIGERLGITVNGDSNMTPGQAIAPRLGAMRTVGLLEKRVETGREEDTNTPFRRHVWVLTDKGRQIVGGKLTKSVDTALGRLDSGQLVLVVQQALRTGYREGDRTTALALRRQTVHDFAQRKVSFRQ